MGNTDLGRLVAQASKRIDQLERDVSILRGALNVALRLLPPDGQRAICDELAAGGIAFRPPFLDEQKK